MSHLNFEFVPNFDIRASDLNGCHIRAGNSFIPGSNREDRSSTLNTGKIARHIYRKIYEFAASAGAYEGYVYQRSPSDLNMDALADWIQNLAHAYRSLPPEVLGQVQEGCTATLGRAIRSLFSSLGENQPNLKNLSRIEGIRLIPPDPAFCEGRAVPVVVSGINCAVVIPEEKVRLHQWRVVEILAPVKLKEKLKIDDGDRLEIEVTSDRY